jgi:hypothetical protein
MHLPDSMNAVLAISDRDGVEKRREAVLQFVSQ